MFTKDDLKTGMFVKLRNNKLGVVVQDTIVLQNGSYTLLEDYSNELKWRGVGRCDPNCDIIEVRHGGVFYICFDSFNMMDLKYKRDPFTLDKIEDGDIVVTRYEDNDLLLVREYKYCKLGTILIALGDNYESISINSFTEDLVHKQYEEVIIKVYRCNTVDDYNMVSDSNLVYERGE